MKVADALVTQQYNDSDVIIKQVRDNRRKMRHTYKCNNEWHSFTSRYLCVSYWRTSNCLHEI